MRLRFCLLVGILCLLLTTFTYAKTVLIVWEPQDAGFYNRSFIEDLEWEIAKNGHNVRVAWSGRHFLSFPKGELSKYDLIIWAVWEKVFADKEIELKEYLDSGGSLAVLGGVPFCYSVVPQGDGWETIKSTWGNFFGVDNDWAYMQESGWSNEITPIGRLIFPSLGSQWAYGGLTRGYKAKPTTRLYPIIEARAPDGGINAPIALIEWSKSNAKVLLCGYGGNYSNSPFNPNTLTGKQFIADFLKIMLEPLAQNVKAEMEAFRQNQLELAALAALPVPPESPVYTDVLKPRSGDVWIGADGGFLASDFALEAVELWQRNLGQITVTAVADPGTMPIAERWRELNLPFTAQNHGQPYVPYIQYKDAWEWNWHEVPMSDPTGGPLWGEAHAMALPHEDIRHLFERVVVACIRKGAAGFGFQDMVWMWGGGRGKAGYNPQTVEAFRADLSGTDSGIRIYTENGIETRYFADYYESYFGIKPTPELYNLEDWSQYKPPTAQEYQFLSSELKQRHETLFDVLCHYEWLKFNQFLGDIAAKEGGIYHVIINPEDMANGTDSLWLNRLVNVHYNCDEFFHDAYQQTEAAYLHWPYFLTVPKGDNQIGICMETGRGGNAKPYYHMALSYGMAYEITAALGAEFLEADFWPGNRLTVADSAKNVDNRQRMRQVLVYGLGFKHAYQDKLRRAEPQFITVTQRRNFRPWGLVWNPWSVWISHKGSFEETLRAMGYTFSGWADDGLNRLPDEHNYLFYCPELASLYGLENISNWLKAKAGRTAVLSAASLAMYVDKTGVIRSNEGEVFGLKVQFGQESIAGTLTDENGAVFQENRHHLPKYYELAGRELEHLYFLGEIPVVSQLKVGDSRLVILHFDPEEVELFDVLVGRLLREDGIYPELEYEGEFVARVYESEKGYYALGITYTPTTNYSKSEYEVLPYKDPNVSGVVRFKLKPETDYYVLYYLEGRSTTMRTDAEGWLSLPFAGAHYGLLFVSEAGKKDLLAEKELQAKALVNYWESDDIELPVEVRLGR